MQLPFLCSVIVEFHGDKLVRVWEDDHPPQRGIYIWFPSHLGGPTWQSSGKNHHPWLEHHTFSGSASSG